MRRDLLAAQAAINWTVSKLPSFEKRLDRWANRNVEILVKDSEPPGDNHLVVAKEKRLLPFKFSVEAGAYLNTIRSSLDILATTLSTRNGKTGNVEAHFPIFRSDLDMLDPLTGLEQIKWLSQDHRTIIKSLQPYPGGNDALCAIHKLDIMRKHRRLLETRTFPRNVTFKNVRREHVIFPAIMGVGANGETLLAFLSKAAPSGEISAAFHVVFAEAGRHGELPVTGALQYFARTATEIIKQFN